MATSKKMCVCGGVSLAIGVILLVAGITLPILINNEIREQVPLEAAVNKVNQENWDDVPGPFNVEVVKWTYLYDWTNQEDVILDGAKPEFTEVGPIPYYNL